MIDKETFENIKNEHGAYASWAVWKNEEIGSAPTSDIDDLSAFDLPKNPQLLQQLKPSIVMVGLNWGGDGGVITKEQAQKFNKFSNFHNTSEGRSKDFKLRYAFRDTEFYGAYMTDIIKYYAATRADANYLNNSTVKQTSKKIFEAELKDLNCKNELIIAFGKSAYSILTELFGKKYNIKPVTHYSFAGTLPIIEKPSNKKNYRELVLEHQLKNWKR
jgi:hypothetical protein